MSLQSFSRHRTFDLAAGAVTALTPCERTTLLWWVGLCLISGLNVIMWSVAARVELPDSQYQLSQLMLSGIYVAVCAFRSVFPRVDLERLCLWDTRVSAIFTGRFAATVAEICFAVQCALFLAKLSEMTAVPYVQPLAAAIVPMIVLAQLLCWFGVLTLNHFGHVVEELLWALAVALLAVGLAGCWSYSDGALRLAIAVGMVCCAGTALLIVLIDVPMYLSRWRHHRGIHNSYMPLVDGLHDTLTRRHATRDWRVWRREVPWMTLYFSVGVWLSIGMALLEALAP